MFEQDKMIPLVYSANWLQHVKPRTSSSFVSKKKRVFWYLPRSTAETHAIRAIWIVYINGGGISYSLQHRLCQAMTAFGQIIKSMFILRYIDRVELRKAIKRQLSKIELANGFTRAVAVGNPCGLEYAEKFEQEIAEGLQPIDQEFIICQNYINLTRKVAMAMTEEERKRLLNIIEAYSPQS